MPLTRAASQRQRQRTRNAGLDDTPADAPAQPNPANLPGGQSPLTRNRRNAERQADLFGRRNVARQANLFERRNVAAAPGGRIAWVRYLDANEKDYARPRQEVRTLTDDLWADSPGYAFEGRERANLTENPSFNTIDKIERIGNNWIGISLKSRNLMNHIKSDRSATRATLNKYLNQVKNFKYGRANGKFITVNKTKFGRRAGPEEETIQVDRLNLLIAVPAALREEKAVQLAAFIREWSEEKQAAPIHSNEDTGRRVPITIDIKRSRGHWQKDTGYTYEDLLDCRINGKEPGNFPVIDMLRGDTVTSVKTMNVVKKYRRPGGGMDTTAVQRQIEEYIWSLHRFEGAAYGDIRVTRNQFSRKVLKIAIPENTGPEFDEAMRNLEHMARSCEVQVLIDRIGHARP